MRAPAISPASKPLRWALALTALVLAATLTSASAMADESSDEPQPTDDGATLAGALGDAEVHDAALFAEGTSTLASYLASGELRLSADVALSGPDEEAEPLVGSFTVDGLTYAVVGEGQVALVAVTPSMLAAGLAGGSTNGPSDVSAEDLADGSYGAEGAARGIGSGVPTSPQPLPAPSAEADGSEGGPQDAAETLALPDSISFAGVDYALVAVGPRALSGCDAAAVVLPASVASVDEAAFRGSSVAAVEVAEGNPHLSSFDGMLFDADRTSLLLIPEGKQGAARIPKEAVSVPPDAFSHGASVTSVSVEAGSAAYLSRNGCLYDASGETLLRAPAGVTDISIADGCTTVAAGSLEGCDALATIHVPASVIYVSPDLFDSVPEVVSPDGRFVCGAVQLADSSDSVLSGRIASLAAPKLVLPDGASDAPWRFVGLAIGREGGSWHGSETTVASLGERLAVATTPGYTFSAYGNGGTLPDGSGSANANYGTVYLDGPTVTLVNDSPAAGSYTFTNPGCTFAHWSWVSGSSGDGGVNFFEDAANPTYANYWAIWKDIPLTWNPNGGRWDSDSGSTDPQVTKHISGQKTSGPSVPIKKGYVFAGWLCTSGGPSEVVQEVTATVQASFEAQWNPIETRLVLDANGGSFDSGAGVSVKVTYGEEMPLSGVPLPDRGPDGAISGSENGWRFEGYFDSTGQRATQYYRYDSETGVLSSAKRWDGTSGGDATLYARWAKEVRLCCGEKPSNTMEKAVVYGHPTSAVPVPQAPGGGWEFQGYFSGEHCTGDRWFWATGAANIPSMAWPADIPSELYAGWSKAIWLDHGHDDGSGEEVRVALGHPTSAVPVPQAPGGGWEFQGYFSGEHCTGDRWFWATGAANIPSMAWPADIPSELYAGWAAIIAVDAPIGLDIEMDVLGVEAQKAGSGKLVSRSGVALQVAEVACEPYAESAEDLFGWGSQDEGQVSLTVTADGAPEGPSPLAFALGGPSSEADPDALVPFALPDGYGSELALSYGIAMPAGYAIPTSYPQQRTPIARLTYTVRLAEGA